MLGCTWGGACLGGAWAVLGCWPPNFQVGALCCRLFGIIEARYHAEQQDVFVLFEEFHKIETCVRAHLIAESRYPLFHGAKQLQNP